jgi:hypothetical protein
MLKEGMQHDDGAAISRRPRFRASSAFPEYGYITTRIRTPCCPYACRDPPLTVGFDRELRRKHAGTGRAVS